MLRYSRLRADPSLLTYAIEFVQDVQLFCLAIVFAVMAFRDRENVSLRWMAYSLGVAIVDGLATLLRANLPVWIIHGLVLVVPPIGYLCFHVALVLFFNKGFRTRWIPLGIVFVSAPFYVWASQSSTPVYAVLVQDISLALQTAVLAVVLLRYGKAAAVLLPSRTMALFLALYSVNDVVRLVVEVVTRREAGEVSHALDVFSGMVYVIAGSVLPLAYIWMMNARLTSELSHQTVIDPLTQVLNRRGLERAGEHALALAGRARFDVAAIAVDIDHFKRLNDTYGHAGGDVVLTETARVLSEMMRQTDSIGRIGGEEFVIVLTGTNRLGARDVVERLRARLEWHEFTVEGKAVHLTSSFGMSFLDGRRTLTWRELLREADLALYEAKRQGRNRAIVYEETKAL